MFCGNCGTEVDDGESFCPECGAPLTPENAEGNGNGTGKVQEFVNKFTEKIQDIVKKAGTGAASAPVIAVVAVVLVVVLVAANASRIGNFVHKTFSSPEKYYQYVEKKAAHELISNSGDMYKNLALNYMMTSTYVYTSYSMNSYNMNSYNMYRLNNAAIYQLLMLETGSSDKNYSGEISVELGKDGEELLELAGLAGIDLSGLKSVSVSASANTKDNRTSFEAALSSNSKDIISGNGVFDIKDGKFYFQVPELNSDYIEIDMDDVYYDYDEIYEQRQMMQDVLDALPSESKFEDILEDYVAVALKNVDKVSSSSKSISVGGVEQKCTELKVTFDADTLEDMTEAILKDMKKDKEIKKTLENIAKAADADFDSDDYEDYIDDMLDDLDYAFDDDLEIVMKVYVDGKGKIRGRVIEYEDGYDSFEVSMLMPQKGRKVGYELSIDDDGETVKLTGEGKKSGDKVTGDFTVKYNGTSIVDLSVKKLDVESLKSGKLNGKIEASVSSKLAKVTGSISGMSIIEDIRLTVDAETDDNSFKYKIGVIYDDEDIGTITLSAKSSKGSKVSLPSSKDTVSISDEDDLLEWVEDIDWSKFLNNLDKANLPDDVIDEIEDAIDDIEDGYIF
jgi:hypothetical protein